MTTLPTPRQIRQQVASGLTPLDLDRHTNINGYTLAGSTFTQVPPTGNPTMLGRAFVTAGEPEWPTRLSGLEPNKGGPLWFWVSGQREALNVHHTVAVSGDRSATDAGAKKAYAMGTYFARHNVAVVTTMTTGIDQAVMRGCLDRGGVVIVVLDTGLDVDHPEGASELKRQIRERGCLVSEFPPTMPVRTFDQSHLRNRLVAGFADAVVSIDVRAGSTVFNLAERAFRFKKPVLLASTNPNRSLTGAEAVLVEQGARLARGADDILAVIGAR